MEYLGPAKYVVGSYEKKVGTFSLMASKLILKSAN